MAKVIWRAGKIGITVLLAILVIGVVLYSARRFAFAEGELIQPSAASLDIMSDAIWASGYTDDPNAIPLGDTPSDFLILADHCFKNGKHAHARQLYQEVLSISSDDAVALSAYKGMIMLNSEIIPDPNIVPITVSDLKTDFASHTDLPGAIFDIAKHCHNKALKMGPRSQRAVSDALLQQAVPLLKESITNIPEDQKPKAYMMLAESYERLGNHSQALAYYQKLLEKRPDYKYAWHVYYLMGRCYQQLAKTGVINDWQANDEIYQLYAYLLQEYPDCKAANAVSKWFERNAQQTSRRF